MAPLVPPPTASVDVEIPPLKIKDGSGPQVEKVVCSVSEKGNVGGVEQPAGEFQGNETMNSPYQNNASLSLTPVFHLFGSPIGDDMPMNFYPDETLIHLINLGMAPDLAELVAQGQFDLFTIKRTGPSSSPLPSQGTSGTQGQFSGDPDGLVLRQTDGKFDKQAHAMDVINVTTPDN